LRGALGFQRRPRSRWTNVVSGIHPIFDVLSGVALVKRLVTCVVHVYARDLRRRELSAIALETVIPRGSCLDRAQVTNVDLIGAAKVLYPVCCTEDTPGQLAEVNTEQVELADAMTGPEEMAPQVNGGTQEERLAQMPRDTVRQPLYLRDEVIELMTELGVETEVVYLNGIVGMRYAQVFHVELCELVVA
jgi:hypothetical protein